MNNINSFRNSWDVMSTPPQPDTITIRPIKQTNAYLAKYFDSSFGLFLRDTTDKIPKRTYKHIVIIFKKKQHISIPGQGSMILRDCLIMRADNEVKAPLLSMVLEFLYEKEPSGQFTASDLISVLDDVEELMRKPTPPPTLQEVTGVWGELYLLRMLINNSNNHQRQFDILKGWEGEIREKIDFKFLFCKQVLEVKTTVTNERIHHLHGIEQVTIPAGFNNGVLASLILEIGQGSTNLMLIDSIRDCFKGTSEEKKDCLELLEKRIMLRGDACNDSRFSLELIQNGLNFYPFEVVPAPGESEGVVSVEWKSDLKNSLDFSYSETDELIRKITE